jgi:hypothetical protein
VAADHAQLAAIERPVKVGDLFGCEVGELLSRRTVERLKPEVIDVLVTELIDHSFAIMSEADSPKGWNRTLQFHKFGVLRRIDRDQGQLLFGSADSRKGRERRELAVRRNVEPPVGWKLGESFRLPAIQRHPGQFCTVELVRVVDPFSIGRAYWKPIPSAVAELFEVSAAGVHAPDGLRSRAAVAEHRKTT